MMSNPSPARRFRVDGNVGCFFLLLLAAMLLFFTIRPSRAHIDSYNRAVNAEVASLDDWLHGFSIPPPHSALDSHGDLTGAYVEWVTGPCQKNMQNIVLGGADSDDVVEVHGGEIFDRGFRGENVYTRRDDAAYIVIVRAYKEYEASAEVEYGAGGMEKRSGTACSVEAMVFDRKTRKLVSRRNFESPARWYDMHTGSVVCDKLSEVDSWLGDIGLHKSDWLVATWDSDK